MEILYLVKGNVYIDTYSIKEKLGLNTSELQHLLKRYKFPESEIVRFKNVNLYPVDKFKSYLMELIAANE